MLQRPDEGQVRDADDSAVGARHQEETAARVAQDAVDASDELLEREPDLVLSELCLQEREERLPITVIRGRDDGHRGRRQWGDNGVQRQGALLVWGVIRGGRGGESSWPP